MSCGFPYCGGVDCANCHAPASGGVTASVSGEPVERIAAVQALQQAAHAELTRSHPLLAQIAKEAASMMASRTEIVDGLGNVHGYKIKTGALHRILGHLSAAGHSVVITRTANVTVELPGLAALSAPASGGVTSAGVVPIKDHQIAGVVTHVTEVARKYHGTQQLRERVRDALNPLIEHVRYAAPSADTRGDSVRDELVAKGGAK